LISNDLTAVMDQFNGRIDESAVVEAEYMLPAKTYNARVDLAPMAAMESGELSRKVCTKYYIHSIWLYIMLIYVCIVGDE
jgi:hypothetical protein